MRVEEGKRNFGRVSVFRDREARLNFVVFQLLPQRPAVQSGREAKMKEKKRALNVELTLEGEVKERFRAIKRAKGLTDDEVLRLIINEYFEKKLVGGS